jgi:hypothetical protein
MTDMLFARHGVLEERNTLARADVLPDFVLELSSNRGQAAVVAVAAAEIIR